MIQPFHCPQVSIVFHQISLPFWHHLYCLVLEWIIFCPDNTRWYRPHISYPPWSWAGWTVSLLWPIAEARSDDSHPGYQWPLFYPNKILCLSLMSRVSCAASVSPPFPCHHIQPCDSFDVLHTQTLPNIELHIENIEICILWFSCAFNRQQQPQSSPSMLGFFLFIGFSPIPL